MAAKERKELKSLLVMIFALFAIFEGYVIVKYHSVKLSFRFDL